MTERESIKNEVLAVVAAAVRSEQCTSVGQWSASFARIAGFLESKITKEPLDLPTMDDWRYALREGPVGWTHDGNKRVANLATAIVEGKARVIEVDK